jgi:hypothetical protein
VTNEITVDVSIPSGDTTITFPLPKLGVGFGIYIAFRFGGSCNACAPGIPAKLSKCFNTLVKAVQSALDKLNGMILTTGIQPPSIVINGNGPTTDDLTGATFF